jgi:hypothetical protein
VQAKIRLTIFLKAGSILANGTLWLEPPQMIGAFFVRVQSKSSEANDIASKYYWERQQQQA